MTYTMLLTKTATVHHRSPDGPPGRYNEPGWSETTVQVPIYIEPAGASEDTAGRETVSGTLRAFLEPTVDLDALDLVVVDGVVYEVVTSQTHNDGLSGAAHHIEATLTESS